MKNIKTFLTAGLFSLAIAIAGLAFAAFHRVGSGGAKV